MVVIGQPPPPGISLTTRETVVVLTPSQIQNLNNTSANAVELISAQGANTLIIVEYVDANLQYGGVQYATGTAALDVSYDQGANSFLAIAASILSSATIKAAASNLRSLGGFLATQSSVYTFLNKRVVANISNGTKYTAGNSYISLRLRWRVIDFVG